ncbi:phosphotransferase family protein [Streptomyces sp. NPDC050161]|uniref:phosphotransferase family protein n=1 Tax=Streptomyces sp. NPDC050161 TaxID=3365604 RepID=UPI003797D113
MSSSRWGTHAVEMTADHVIKRFPRKGGGCAQREWRALTLLATYAPGLAPEPREADLAALDPVVVMSRLAGTPLRGTAVEGKKIEALAKAVTTLYAAVPTDVVCKIPLRPGHQEELVSHLDEWAVTIRPRAGGPVRQAMDTGLDWLARSGLRAGTPPEIPPVFGPGDGNLANYLWDGSRVQVVDFEGSGRSDRAFELAEITEHVGSWVEHPLDVSAFLEQFELSPAETARLRGSRRLLALVWLFLLAGEATDRPRNPPGTVERQADRVLELLA